MVLAVKTDEVARPLELVVTTHFVEVGLPPLQEAKVPDAPEVGALKVTLAPATGLPCESVTLTTSGLAKAAVDRWLVCGDPEYSAIVAGGPMTVQQ